MSKVLHLIILGPPGAGKGTISFRIIKEFPLAYVASGDLLRRHVSKNTVEGIAAKGFINKGQLVPDDLVTKLVLKELHCLTSNWLLDGFPRTIQQTEILSKEARISSVINLNVPDEVIIERLKGRWIHISSGRIYHTEFSPPHRMGIDDVTGEPLIQREDDKPDTVKTRLMTYKTITAPVLEYFKKKKLLQQFSGSYTNEVWPEVYKYVKTLM